MNRRQHEARARRKRFFRIVAVVMLLGVGGVAVITVKLLAGSPSGHRLMVHNAP